MRHRTCAIATALFLSSGLAAPKNHGVSSPGGKEIYKPGETFAEIVDSDTRYFVVETAIGAGPEGNLGILLGLINQPVKGLEFYAGFGVESNPARNYTGTARYMFNIDGYRPYVGLGYMYKDLFELRTFSHSLFAETGYKWVIGRTYHLTASIGIRRILHVGIRNDSPLLADDVDPVLLQEQQDNISRWTPLIALRFSRAF